MHSEFPLTGGVTRFPVSWPYLERSHVLVQVDGLPVAYTWLSDTLIQVTDLFGAPMLGTKLTITRITPDDVGLADIKDAGNLTAAQLNRLRLQLLFLIQERSGGIAGSLVPAIQAAVPGLGQLNNDLDNIKAILDALMKDLQSLDDLNADLDSTSAMAAQTREQFLAALFDTTDKLAKLDARITTLQNQQNGFGAMVSNEAYLRTSEDSSLTLRIDTATSEFRDADTLIRGAITTLEGTLADTEQALAGRIDTVQAAVGQGENIFPNSGLVAAVEGWPAAGMLDRTASGVPANSPGARVLKLTALSTTNTRSRSPVTPGSVLDIQVWAAASTTRTLTVKLKFFSADGAGPVTDPGGGTGAQQILPAGSAWTRCAGVYTVPANASTVQVSIDQSAAAALYLTLPDIRIRPAALAAVEQATTAVANRTGTVEAQHTIKVVARQDGKKAVAGIGLNSTVTAEGAAQSEVILMANRFLLTPPDDIEGSAEPLLVAGTVNGTPTTVFPAAKFGDQTVGAKVLVDGSVQARHMLLTGGGGAALNLDPGLQDPSAWTIVGTPGGFKTVEDGVAGTIAFRATGQASLFGAQPFPVVAGKRYRVSAWIRCSEGAIGSARLRYAWRATDSGGLASENTVQTYVNPTTSWTRYVLEVVMPAGRRYAVPILVLGVATTGGYHEAQDVRFEEMIDSSLVVQGGIKADRIDTQGMVLKNDDGTIAFASGTSLREAVVAAGGTALWAQVTGAGKPEDGATAGATVGSDVRDANGNLIDTLGGANLLLNAGFEDATNFLRSWSSSTGGTTGSVTRTRVPENGVFGDYGVRIDASGIASGGVAGLRQDVATASLAGDYLTLSADAYGTPGQRCQLIVQWYDSGGATANLVNYKYTTLSATKTRVSVTTTTPVPVEAVGIRVYVRLYGPSASAVAAYIVLDNIQLEVGQVMSAYGPSPRDKVGGDNPITSGNVTTFIANGAIGSLQVGVLTAANLTVGALSDTVNGGASSGGRVTIQTNKVSVYDASGTLRNVMGYLL